MVKEAPGGNASTMGKEAPGPWEHHSQASTRQRRKHQGHGSTTGMEAPIGQGSFNTFLSLHPTAAHLAFVLPWKKAHNQSVPQQDVRKEKGFR
eukprot:933101-Pelagomonas_calceolata.AAC.6